MGPREHGHVVSIPLWMFPAALGAYPVLSLGWEAARALTRNRRKMAGSCRRCGYDLRATPDRCPECGAKTSSDRSDKP